MFTSFGNFSLNILLFFINFILFIPIFFFRKKYFKINFNYILPFILFIIIISVLNSTNVPKSIYSSISFGVSLYLIFVFKNIENIKNIKFDNLINIYILGGIILSFLIYIGVFLFPVTIQGDRKIFFANPNLITSGLCTVIPFIFIKALSKKSTLFLILTIIIILSIFVSGSRSTSIVSFTITLCAYLSFLFSKGKISSSFLVIQLILFIFAIIIYSYLILFSYHEERISRLITLFTYFDVSNLGRRVLLYPYYLSLIFDSPFYGYGFGEYGTFNGQIDSPHNTFLSLAYGSGLLLPIIIYSIFLKFLLICFRNIKRSHYYISFFWVFISVSLTSQTNSIELNKYTPILIGLFLSFHHFQSYKK